MSSHLTEEQVFALAADLIEEHGWTRMEYGDADVGYCVAGAIGAAAENSPIAAIRWHHGSETLTYRCLNRLEVKVRRSIFAWNDEADSRSEVIGVLRELAGQAVPVPA